MEQKPACLPAILRNFLMQDILLIHTQKATLTYVYSSLKLTVCLITIHT